MLWGGVSSLKPESDVMVNSPPLLYPPAKEMDVNAEGNDAYLRPTTGREKGEENMVILNEKGDSSKCKRYYEYYGKEIYE